MAVISAADPVDRRTGRLIQLPDAPFLLGVLDPVDVLAAAVGGPVIVDNDVNWAARAERDVVGANDLNDFVYVFLGEGLGAAIASDGEVRRGSSGLAGEIAHLVTVGPRGDAVPLIEVFHELGLRHHGSTAIDVERLLSEVTGPEPRSTAVRQALGRAISGVIAAATALADPQTVIIGGPWGTEPAILEAITTATRRLARDVPVQAAELTVEPALAGARTEAITRLRMSIIAAVGPTVA